VVVSAIAVDGKTSRHTKRADGTRVHLVGAVTHGDGRLIGQVEVAHIYDRGTVTSARAHGGDSPPTTSERLVS
jgi:hypothetical protein